MNNLQDLTGNPIPPGYRDPVHLHPGGHPQSVGSGRTGGRQDTTAPADSDGDGLIDNLEVILGTSLLLVDSDGAGDYVKINYDGNPGLELGHGDLYPRALPMA